MGGAIGWKLIALLAASAVIAHLLPDQSDRTALASRSSVLIALARATPNRIASLGRKAPSSFAQSSLNCQQQTDSTSLLLHLVQTTSTEESIHS
ncbi:hypothetical protein [Scytonema sp. NUACC26]|uniref:hypothetical protein n=1 Tax=Scytonema sp. NUACC26 TaxID=3140176 RepID=UPI0038B40239